MRGMWTVEGKDIFANEWYPIGTFPTREAAVAAVRAAFDRLQPASGMPDLSGGPQPPGIQDRIFVVPPEGEGEGCQYLGE